MTNATNRYVRNMQSKMSRPATWAGVSFHWTSIRDEASQQTATRVAQGVEGQRIDVVGVIPKYWTSFSGGMVRRAGLHPDTDLNQVYYNQGLQTHVPYQLTLPYALTTQATFLSGDFSGYRAANKRVHGVIFNNRFVGAIGSQIIKDTSTTDPTLTVPATSDGVTDLITAMWVGMVGTMPAVFIGTDGTTDDVSYTTDPFADTISWTKFVTLGNAADYISAGQYFPNIGNGYHVIIGRIGNSPSSANGVWFVSKDATLPATAKPVVYESTKDVEDLNASTFTTSMLSPTFYLTSDESGFDWTTPENVLASDNARGRSPDGTVVGSNHVATLKTWGYDTAGAGIADSDRITGYQTRVEALRGSDTTTATYVSVSLSGLSLEIGHANLTTSDANYDFGSTTNRYATNKTGADMKTLVATASFQVVYDGAGNNNYVDVDYGVGVILTYKPMGTQIKLQSGGFPPGPWPSRPNTLVYVEPETDDETGVTKSRRLVFINITYDPEGNRPVAEVEYPDTGLSYIEDCWPWQGGIMCAGNKSSGLGKQLKHVAADGAIRQYQFPGFHGSHTVGVVMGFDEGVTALVEVADEDGSETQWWRLVDQQFHASTPLQSKSNAIASLPLAWAERTLHRPQNHAYRFFPVSTTHLAAARTFVPRNPLNDVLSANTTQAKHDGPLYLITPEFELGNFENESALMLIRHGGRQISATASTYGTVKYDFEVSTDSTAIDTSFASPDVTTGNFDTPFQEYQVPSSGKPYRTIQGRITLNNAGSSNKTPNGVPFYTETVSARPHLGLYRVFVDWKTMSRSKSDWLTFVSELLAASAGSPVNALKIGGVSKTAQLVGWTSEWKPSDIEQVLREEETDNKGQPRAPFLLFKQVRGKASA